MEDIKLFLEKMSETSSLNEKRKIFKEFSENETILKIFKYAYDNVEFTFGIKPARLDFTKNGYSTDIGEMFRLLDNLNNRTFSGNSAVEECNKFIENSDKNLSNIFYKILDRDLKIGFSKKEFNKLVSGQFKCKNVNYCRCDVLTSKSKMTFPAFIQLKCDGTYREAYVHNGIVDFKTRSGEQYQNPILSEIMKDLPNGYYIGEFTIGKADNPSLNRSEGNGLINSDNPPYDKIHFTVWDYLEEDVYALKKHVPYSSRLSSLQFNLLNIKSELIQVVPTHIVKSIDEALDKVSQWMNDGLEGGILKSFETRFKNGTSKEQLKIKLKVDADLRCVGFVKGSKGTKYENKNKVILFESDDKKIKGQCSGMTDSQVDEVTKNPTAFIGKILSVEFNDLTKAQDNDYYALSHPRFLCFRDDKTESDTYERVVEMRDMAKNIKS